MMEEIKLEDKKQATKDAAIQMIQLAYALAPHTQGFTYWFLKNQEGPHTAKQGQQDNEKQDEQAARAVARQTILLAYNLSPNSLELTYWVQRGLKAPRRVSLLSRKPWFNSSMRKATSRTANRVNRSHASEQTTMWALLAS